MWQRLGRRKIFWDFAVLGKVTRKRARFLILDSSGGDRRVVVIYIKAEAHQPVRNISLRGVVREVAYDSLHGFLGFWKKKR
jgi:hypothetical protein